MTAVPAERAHVIVIGNEKGGTGKSTVAMHLAVSLLRAGCAVGTMDLDAGQGTFTRYIENRRRFAQAAPLPLPTHKAVMPEAGEAGLMAAFAELAAGSDFVVIDTPGADTELSRAGHALADTLVTPLNDSLIDLDVLAAVNPDTMRITGPSRYAAMVWDIKKIKALRERTSIDWVVLRNRLAHVDARNKREMERLLGELSKRIGFRPAPGLSERVVFRELFLKGLTLLDLRDPGAGAALTMSHVAARQELRALLDFLRLPKGLDASVRAS